MTTPRYRPAASLDKIRSQEAAKRAVENLRSIVAKKKATPVGRTYGPFGLQTGGPFQPQAAAFPPVEEAYGGGGGGGGGGGAELLAALGGAPDKGAYVKPFDEAAARAQAAADASSPTIRDAYLRARAAIEAGQGEFASTQSRVAAEAAARQAAGQQAMAQQQAPVLGDLGATFGADTLGSLTGAVGAQAAQQQAGMTETAARQGSLASELAAQQARSSQTRVADSHLGEAGALAAAKGNLNAILNQLGVQRAGAERQFANDAQAYDMQRAQFARADAAQRAQSRSDPMDALNYQLKALELQRGQLELQRGPDPLVALERQVKERQLNAALAPAPGTSAAWKKKAARAAVHSPGAYSYLAALTDANGTKEDALAGMQADLAHWAEDKRGKGQYVIHQGKRVDPAVIRGWLKSYYGGS